MEMNFCRRCGSSLTQHSPEKYKCANNHTLYVNPVPAVGVFFVTQTNEVMLAVRGIEPFKGSLDSFGGFIDDQETAEQALARELQEEVGLTPNDYETPTFLSTEICFYPYDGEIRSVLSTFFWSRLRPHANPLPADDVAELAYVPLADIAFTKMDNIDVKEAIQKLQKLLL